MLVDWYYDDRKRRKTESRKKTGARQKNTIKGAKDPKTAKLRTGSGEQSRGAAGKYHRKRGGIERYEWGYSSGTNCPKL